MSPCFRVIASITLFGVSMGCGPKLTPVDDWQGGSLTALEKVPILVVAQFEANRVILDHGLYRKRFPSFGDVALCQNKIAVQNVLKGDISLGETSLFYFADIRPYGTHANLSRGWGIGSLHLLGLRREAGVLRPMADFYSVMDVPMYSGLHPGFMHLPHKRVEESVIDLFLTRGEAVSDEQMIEAAFNRLPPMISEEYTAKKLLQLAAIETPAVRAAACQQWREIMVESVDTGQTESPLSREYHVSADALQRWQTVYATKGPASIQWFAPGYAVLRLAAESRAAAQHAAVASPSLCSDE